MRSARRSRRPLRQSHHRVEVRVRAQGFGAWTLRALRHLSWVRRRAEGRVRLEDAAFHPMLPGASRITIPAARLEDGKRIAAIEMRGTPRDLPRSRRGETASTRRLLETPRDRHRRALVPQGPSRPDAGDRPRQRPDHPERRGKVGDHRGRVLRRDRSGGARQDPARLDGHERGRSQGGGREQLARDHRRRSSQGRVAPPPRRRRAKPDGSGLPLLLRRSIHPRKVSESPENRHRSSRNPYEPVARTYHFESAGDIRTIQAPRRQRDWPMAEPSH